MPRTVEKTSSTKTRNYSCHVSKTVLEKAKNDVQQKNMSVRKAAQKWKLGKSTLHDYIKGIHTKPVGRQPVLSPDEEHMLCTRIITLAEWGFPLDVMDLRMLVKAYLDRRGIVCPRFTNNVPGRDWGYSFLKRHKDVLTSRVSQNVKTDRARVTKDKLNEFYENLKVTLEGVPPENIINYDETNLTDDPGKKKILVRRGTKYPERVINSTKSSISIMFSGTAAGHLLPPYVVYKAVHLYDTWTEGGPQGTRYNRTLSGWFESSTFEDWFNSIILPYAKDRTGKVVLIGDNLASHVNDSVILACEGNNIDFVLLPANSTHLTQPLDVAVFRPLKSRWRKVLENLKKTTVGRLRKALPKDCFPSLLCEVMEEIQKSVAHNIKSGFRKCGIHPLDPLEAISRLPQEQQAASTDNAAALDSSVIDMLKEMRHGSGEASTTAPKRKKRLAVQPGQSITTKSPRTEDTEDITEDEHNLDDPQEQQATSSTAIKDPTAETAPQPGTSTQRTGNQNVGEVAPADWLVVKVPFDSMKKFRYFIALVVHVEPEIHVKFLKHVRGTCHTFVYPKIDDYSDIDLDDIIKVLPEPAIDNKCRMIFDVDVNLWPK